MRRTDGFSLIEAVVVIAIMAILAGAAAPLLVKTIDQQRTQTTQASLQTAWTQLFGSQSSRVYNMRADFGFQPPAATLTDLGKMLAINAPFTATPPAFGLNAPAPFLSGWNGPYWSGSTGVVNGWNVPVDSWGNPIQLVYSAAGWQLHSGGALGTVGNPGDLVYPSQPVDVNLATGSYQSQIYLSITSSRAQPSTSTSIVVYDRENGAVHQPAVANVTVPAGGSITPLTIPVYAGPVSITINFPLIVAPPGYNPVYFSQIVDLLPGQTQVVNLTLN